MTIAKVHVGTAALDLRRVCGSDTPFDFAQGRLCPTLLTLVSQIPP